MATASLLAGLLPALGGVGGILKKVGTFAGGLLADIGRGNIHSFGDFGRSLAMNASRAITGAKVPATDTLKIRTNKPTATIPVTKPESPPESAPPIQMPPLPAVPETKPKKETQSKKATESTDPTKPRHHRKHSQKLVAETKIPKKTDSCPNSSKKRKKQVFVTNKNTK